MRLRLLISFGFMLVAVVRMPAQDISGRVRVPATVGGQITGQVRYSETGQPAFNVVVSCDANISGRIGQEYTDRNGKFHFANLALAQYTVTIRVPGYREETQTADLLSMPSAYLQFQLKADSSKPAVSVSTGTIAAPVPPAAKSEFDQASTLLVSGKKEDIESAVHHLEKAVSLYPGYTEAELKLGTAYLDLQQWDKADAALKKTIEMDSKAANAYFALGEAYLRQKKYDEAEKTLRDGLAIETRSAQGHLTLARVYWDRYGSVKDESQWRPPLEKAYQEVKQALDLDPNMANAHLLKGDLYFKVHRAEDALKEFDEYLRLEPKGEFAPQTRELAEKIRKALAQTKKP